MPVKEKIYINVENPFTLNDTDKFWMVLSGEVNVFYTKIDESGNYLIPLKHFYTVQKGEILFSLLTETATENNTRLIAFSNDAKLLPIDKSKLLEMDHFFLKNMMNQWISKTTSVVCNGNSPRVYKALDEYKVTLLEKNSIAFPSSGINWVHILKGEVNIYAESTNISYDKLPGFLTPVSNKLWIKSLSNDTEIKVLSTREVLQDEIYFLLSLTKLEEHFYTQLNAIIDTQKLEESKHFQEKRVIEEESIRSTLQKIRSIVAGNNENTYAKASQISNRKNVLFSTCQLIGEQSGFKMDEPKHIESYENSVTNQLYAIAKSSRIRIRKIILRGTWWKEENGHLLAFTKKDKTPVALLQATSSSYILKDLSTGIETIINNEIAETLEPIGYMFFSGFDGKMTSVKKVANFAIKGVKKDAKVLILAALAGSVIGLLVPILSGMMYDDVIPTADKSLHTEVFTIMVMIGLVTAGLHLAQGVLQLRVETKSSINLQAGVMDHMLRLPVTFYKKFSAGDLTNRVLSINTIRQIVSSTLMTAVLSGAFSFVNLGLLFYYDSKLAWIGVCLGLIAVVFMITIGWLKLKYDREVSKYQGEIQGFLFEFLSGISKIRITGGERRIFTLWADKFSKLKKLGFVSGSYQNFVETFNASYPLLTSIFFFSFLYYTVLNSDTATTMLTVGAFMAFITAFNQFLGDSLRLSMALITSLNVITLYERVKPILEEETESADQSVDPGELAGDIEMNSVSFRYNEDQPLVLNNVTFKIKPGEMVAFVGASGSGKSTIMRLLLGFEYPELGSIYFDGDSFDSMNKELVRRQIGVVLQNGSLMSGSIYQNIVGNSELTLDDAWDAARMAGMEEDIKQMPMEMHTVVSEGAGTFSGGQRQRLMIARAIVHKPRLLFMDEATSALDNRTQNIVSESLDKLQATRIIIAHRLSTIKNADRIYVMDKGTIVETGTYEELMELDGLFSQLAKRQIA
ncbi:NHLP bacteriocin export ABC transporter permease/ATPase subunit [Chryseobacterium sp. MEBOG06]|uniref:NHLP bacteriocin export ABC transporter permease/ATPase subunit n=1 Tax=Chryseobacterium sp. MEBOG06 TaxID=2879938 RepID=UPI001F013FD3|nr:NHLP bacteriocin export ABC transporter permease/ATPase subunit [Chryseobacterium sp. MEBOG06]UKB83901.1 NHLP bacteriocin export ABC transporter permease/ATPase subunit [Chryseobacterium sp. MEBOG06]